MQIQNLVPDDASLADLEDLQQQLHRLLVQRFGPATAAAVLGRALAGLSSPDSISEPAAKGTSAAAQQAAAAASTATNGVGVAAEAGPSGRLVHSLSTASVASDASEAASDGSVHSRWQRAVALAHASSDPWASRGIHKLPMEVVTRYRYTASTRTWVKDDVLVKMEARPFAAGAMRECYALKKLSTFSSSVYRDWRKAPNFVAKRYKKLVERSVYFADAVLQMDAKFLGDEYNHTEPPKKVDVMQAAVIEFKDRPNKPLFCIEHMIEGDYVKYNSNSGYVATQPQPLLPLDNGASGSQQRGDIKASAPLPPAAPAAGGNAGNGGPCLHRALSRQSSGLTDQALRNTPQAFSHFTYSFTKGTALCVDIQGVADLYTDPQIHTLDGQGYGDGNLGLRGMALFFRTHECNPLCSKLKLEPFDRCATDVAAQGYTSSSSTQSGTMYRSFSKHKSILGRLALQRQQEQQPGPAKSLKELLAQLECVPLEPLPDAFLHWEVARIYAETVTLPELRPDEDPDAARAGGLFHLTAAAAKGLALAQLELACGHMGLEPNSVQLAHLLKAGKAAGEFEPHPELALRYTQLAAQRGVLTAAVALSYAYGTGEGVGAGVLPGPLPAAAVSWLRKALTGSSDNPSELFGATPDGLNARTHSRIAGGGTPSTTTPKGSLLRCFSKGGKAVSGSPAAFSPSMLVGADGVPVGSLFALADQLNAAATAATLAVRSAFNAAAEEEGKLLPGGSRARYEMWADLGDLLLQDPTTGTGSGPAAVPFEPAVADEEEAALLPVQPDPAAAAEAFNTAAEEASAAFKGKLAQRYYEKAALAEAAAEEENAEE